jgi:signal transduction histidine kinase
VSVKTYFAAPERARLAEIRRQHQKLSEVHTLSNVLSVVPEFVAVLNEERQVVYANHALVRFLKAGSSLPLCGRRPGELLNCIHSAETEHGCATSAAEAPLRFVEDLESTTDSLIEEIQSQKMLVSAENGTLEVQKNLISSGELIDHVVRLFVHDELAEGKHIEIAPFSESLSFINDESTLRRVLVNAVKNALGTYSMKLLTEEYLGGQVSFRSSEQEGTTFIFVIPNRGAG